MSLVLRRINLGNVSDANSFLAVNASIYRLCEHLRVLSSRETRLTSVNKLLYEIVAHLIGTNILRVDRRSIDAHIDDHADISSQFYCNGRE